jgi:prepilin-type N-terminal cleavage/methylation domain-containing protein/prepilin-type processing-associated H-X9-DG protein
MPPRADRGIRRRASSLRPESAFTLIELLVVIGIISLLISILTPSLSRARQQAKSTVCLTRLSEFMKGLTAYSSDFRFGLPPAQFEVRKHSGLYRGWAEVLYESLYNDDDYDKEVSFPVLHNLDGRFDLFECKEAQPRENHAGHYRVYELSWSLGSLDAVKLRLPLIMDANPLVTDPDDLLRADIPKLHIAGLEGEAFIDQRHYDGANYAFPDGHAERSTKLRQMLADDWDLDERTPNR